MYWLNLVYHTRRTVVIWKDTWITCTQRKESSENLSAWLVRNTGSDWEGRTELEMGHTEKRNGVEECLTFTSYSVPVWQVAVKVLGDQEVYCRVFDWIHRGSVCDCVTGWVEMRYMWRDTRICMSPPLAAADEALRTLHVLANVLSW